MRFFLRKMRVSPEKRNFWAYGCPVRVTHRRYRAARADGGHPKDMTARTRSRPHDDIHATAVTSVPFAHGVRRMGSGRARQRQCPRRPFLLPAPTWDNE